MPPPPRLSHNVPLPKTIACDIPLDSLTLHGLSHAMKRGDAHWGMMWVAVWSVAAHAAGCDDRLSGVFEAMAAR